MDNQILKELQQIHTIQKMWGLEVFTWIEDLAFKKLAKDYHICNENSQLINMLGEMFDEYDSVTVTMMLDEARTKGIMEDQQEE